MGNLNFKRKVNRRLQIWVDDVLLTRIKAMALIHGVTMSDLSRALLHQCVNEGMLEHIEDLSMFHKDSDLQPLITRRGPKPLSDEEKLVRLKRKEAREARKQAKKEAKLAEVPPTSTPEGSCER